jgi:hypothetical protein
MKTPLNEILIKCSECGEESSASTRHHTAMGAVIGLPKTGLEPEQITQLKTMILLCECCQEEKEDRE